MLSIIEEANNTVEGRQTNIRSEIYHLFYIKKTI